jgi:F0F1-type ATP synthase assembly protein I
MTERQRMATGKGAPMPSEAPRKPEPKQRVNLAGASAVGSEFVGFPLVGILIDYALGNFQAIPWATLILTPLGLVVGTFHIYQMMTPRPKP